MEYDIYRHINDIAKATNARVYLVGGCVRDIILNRRIFDIDLLVYGTKDFVYKLSKRVPSTLICLDKERGIFRLAVRKSDNTIDISLETDDVSLSKNLSQRDFTLNAMAIKVDDFANPYVPFFDVLIDPFNGRQDARKGIIRLVHEENLEKDPLRLCRAFRLGAQLNFMIDKKTLEAISDKVPLINNNISPERIHEEWCKMMQSENAAHYVDQMKQTGLLCQIFPETGPMNMLDQGEMHAFELWGHSLSTLLRFEEMINNKDEDLTPVLKGLVHRLKSDYSAWITCLKTAALLHDLGKPGAKGIGRKGQVIFYGHPQAGAKILCARMKALRFSNDEIGLAAKIVHNHMRPLLLFQAKRLTDKTTARLFIHLGETWPAILLLSIADVKSTKTEKKEITAY
ncbi:CCA tRNA nucleotidyltransferase, partial [bacterium]|nr:CCA tRNA nucleotidyltransferase [bacterium]